MDHARAHELLTAERTRVTELLADTTAVEDDVTRSIDDPGDLGDRADLAQPLESEAVEDAVAASLRERLAGIDRAFERLEAGTYGVSTQSGEPIPDERLEHDPAAELTVEEAAAREA